MPDRLVRFRLKGGKKRVGWLVAMFLLGTFCLTLGGTSEAVAATPLFLNGFYAINSDSEINQVQNLSSVSLGWARIIRDNQGQIRFCTSGKYQGPGDEFPEYGVPANVSEVARQLKQTKALKYLSVFCMDGKPGDQSNIPLEMLSLSDGQLVAQVINPLVDFLDHNPAGISFAGVVIDAEGLREWAPYQTWIKQRFNRFLDLLDERLGNRELLVCLTPERTYNPSSGYDFVHIGKRADTIILMAHDYDHYTPGNSRPDIPATAPYYLVQEAIEKTISAGIPREKILLAIALHGIQWTRSNGQWVPELSRPTLNKIERIASGQEGPVVRYLSGADRYLANYWWGGKLYEYRTGYLKIQHWQKGKLAESEFYFEIEQSLAEKIELARSSKLKGISIWRLGIGNPETWKVITTYCTAPCKFFDLGTHWARPEVEYLEARGLIKGVSARQFNPEGKMTRAEFSALMAGILHLPDPGGNPVAQFKDVKKSDWYYRAVNQAVGAGLLEGKSANRFYPQDLITREEAAVLAVRALKYRQIKLAANTGKTVFSDAWSISWWANADVQLAVNQGIITGYPNGNKKLFKPQGKISRAEGTVMIKRIFDRIEKET